jgi:prophage antirepressor-like protein
MPNTSRELEIFNYKGSDVRADKTDGQPWFVLVDVCRVLGIGNPRDVAKRIPDRHKGMRSVDTPGGAQQMRMVSRPGLYRAIFMSRKPEAQDFIDWVTEEMIPAVMDTGQYVAPDHIRKMLGLEMIERAEIENESDSHRWRADEQQARADKLEAELAAERRLRYALECDHPKREEDGSCTLGKGCSFYR